MSMRADFSHDFPMPKKNDIVCPSSHIARAIHQSPIRCSVCSSTEVSWVTPPPIKHIRVAGVEWSFNRRGRHK